MRITESQLRRIVRQTVIEENRKRILQESVMQKLASRPMMLFSLMMVLSGCTGKSIDPQDTRTQEAQTEWVKDAVEEKPETLEEAIARIEKMNISPKDKQFMIDQLKFLQSLKTFRGTLDDTVRPLDQ